MPHMAQLGDFMRYQVHAAIPAHMSLPSPWPVRAGRFGFARAVSDGLCEG